jgi:MFS family permease
VIDVPPAGRGEALRHRQHELDVRLTRHHLPHLAASRRLGFRLLAGALVLALIGANLPSPLYVDYQHEYGFGPEMVTFIFAAYATGVLAALLCLGRLSDHLGRRPVLAAGLALDAVSTVLFLTATGVPMLFLARVVSGLAMGLVLGAATAALAELEPNHDLGRAALVSGIATLMGFGLGPIVSGVVADLAPYPTRFVFGVYLGVLAVAGLAVAAVPETVGSPDRRVSLRPIVAVPPGIRARFFTAAIAIFCAFSVLGLYAGLVSYLLRNVLHDQSHSLAGTVVFALFACAALSELFGQGLSGALLLRAGSVLLVVTLGLVELALGSANLGLLLVGTVVGGVAVGFTYMASLARVNRMAPAGERGAVLSALFVSAYCGFSIPVIGIGIGTQRVGSLGATAVAAAAIAVLVVLALVLSLRQEAGRRERAA